MFQLNSINKYILITLSFFALNLQAQELNSASKLENYAQNINVFTSKYPLENVYLHFDNTSYFLDETIWFKCYVVRSFRNSLSDISRVLYVELVSAEGNILETKKLKIENGQCHGDFKLNAYNYAGFYEVRAYTRCMLNFGPQNYFSRVFAIYDKPKEDGEYLAIVTERLPSEKIPQIRPQNIKRRNLDLKFYPEGGNIVAGITSKVAFKATGKNGENAVITGKIFNQDNEKVTDISTSYQGMGLFEITANHRKYTAIVNYNNKEYKFELPKALSSGYNMAIDNLKSENVEISITKTKDCNTKTLGLTISCRGILYGYECIDMTNVNSHALFFPKNNLPSGVSQITLYNAAGDVLCERLIFINHHSQMRIQVNQNKLNYKPFEKVSLLFDLRDKHNNPIETTFSLSVRDKVTCASSPYSDNILTNLLLSSELKGHVENPGYYFKNSNPNSSRALELLMLTQGWTRYVWKQMTGATPFIVKQPIEKGLLIDGTVESFRKNKKRQGVDLTMVLFQGLTAQTGKCRTDSTGDFYLKLDDFYGKANLILQTEKNKKRKEKYIRLNRQFSPALRAYTFPEKETPLPFTPKIHSNSYNDTIKLNQEKSKLSLEKQNLLLNELVVKAARNPIKASIRYDIVFEIDKRRDTVNWMPANIKDFLDIKNKYYNYSTNTYKGKKVVFMRDDSNRIIKNENIRASNEITNEFENTTDLPMPQLAEIEYISIIENMHSINLLYNGYADASKTVIVLIHCKKDYRPEPYGVRNSTIKGYAYTKEFYNPKYDGTILPDTKDYRRTLYWNPDVKTDRNGEATVVFYNNSSSSDIKIDAETVTNKGIIGALNQ